MTVIHTWYGAKVPSISVHSSNEARNLLSDILPWKHLPSIFETPKAIRRHPNCCL